MSQANINCHAISALVARRGAVFVLCVLFGSAGFVYAQKSAPKEGIARAGVDGVGVPVCIHCPIPSYTPEAERAKVQGSVILEVLVTAEGRASDISVVKKLGFGLEDKAVAAVKDWRFKPALAPDGSAIPVRVPIEITFHRH